MYKGNNCKNIPKTIYVYDEDDDSRLHYCMRNYTKIQIFHPRNRAKHEQNTFENNIFHRELKTNTKTSSCPLHIANWRAFSLPTAITNIARVSRCTTLMTHTPHLFHYQIRVAPFIIPKFLFLYTETMDRTTPTLRRWTVQFNPDTETMDSSEQPP